jgi:hypothetical protein
MAITAQSFNSDDALPDDCSQGPNPAHGFNVISVSQPQSPTTVPGEVTIVGQLVNADGSPADHDTGFAFLVDDPATAPIAPRGADAENTSTTVGAASNGPALDGLTGYPPGVTS